MQAINFYHECSFCKPVHFSIFESACTLLWLLSALYKRMLWCNAEQKPHENVSCGSHGRVCLNTGPTCSAAFEQWHISPSHTSTQTNQDRFHQSVASAHFDQTCPDGVEVVVEIRSCNYAIILKLNQDQQSTTVCVKHYRWIGMIFKFKDIWAFAVDYLHKKKLL